MPQLPRKTHAAREVPMRSKKQVQRMNVIEAIDVTKSFDASAVHVQAVRGIDMSVHKGEMLAIVGPSGSGTSTLLSLLGAIETPTSGQILLEGVDIATLSDKQRTLLRRH